MAYKLSTDGSSYLDHPKLSSSVSESVCLDRELQFDSSAIHKSEGVGGGGGEGYSVPTIMLQKLGNFGKWQSKTTCF